MAEYRISLRDFIAALKTGKGPSTSALDKLCTVPYDPTSGFVRGLQETISGFTPMPDWAATALRENGASDAEIEHINEWPEDQKISVRDAIVEAINANPQRNVRFFWELSDGDGPQTLTIYDADVAETVIRVKTPRSALRTVGAQVEVGL